MEEFKVGDRVTVKRACTGTIPGKVYELKPRRMDNVLCALSNSEVSMGCTCISNWVIIKRGGRDMTKTVWKVIVVDKATDEVLVEDTFIGSEDEKSVIAQVSLENSAELSAVDFANLHYIVKNLGSYESMKK